MKRIAIYLCALCVVVVNIISILIEHLYGNMISTNFDESKRNFEAVIYNGDADSLPLGAKAPGECNTRILSWNGGALTCVLQVPLS